MTVPRCANTGRCTELLADHRRIAIDGLQYTFIDALLRIGWADGR